MEDAGSSTYLTQSTTSSWTAYAVPDITQYKYLLFALRNASSALINSCLVPTSLFKSTFNNQNNYYITVSHNGINGSAMYYGDTSIGLLCDNTSYKISVHGIK